MCVTRRVRFTHRWGGAIDTCSRFSVMFGRVLGGRAVYAMGYTGLGVAASRFGARRALARAEWRDGRRGPWLWTLDRLGMGFDS